MKIAFETILEEHRKSIIDIFNYYVLNTTAAYREEKVNYEFFDNFLTDNSIIKFWVIKSDDEVIGFCTLEYFKNISSFQKTGDVMYFIRPEFTGKGIGSQVLVKLENDAIERGITKIVVDISDDNNGSLRFHKKNGFKQYGKLVNCWEKHGKKLGIVFLEKKLNQ